MSTKSALVKLFGIGLTALSLWGQCASKGSAQMGLIEDSSLGSESTLVTPADAQTFHIENGATRGSNLFHSFEEFNINDGAAAYFLVDNASIENIFSRITGNDASDILGTLGTCFTGGCANGAKPEATVYLMNPNGIFFGENASLDVGGSFVATTANGIQFGSQGTFNSNLAEDSSLLAINPSAFLFSQRPESSIENQSRADADLSLAGTSLFGLRVPDSENLVFLGGDIDITGGGLVALDGRIDVGSVSEASSVSLNFDEENPGLDFPEEIARADISLSENAGVLVAANGTGEITFHARNLEISGASRITAGVFNGGDEISRSENNILPGSVALLTTDTLTIKDIRSAVFNNIINSNSIGMSGNVLVRANQLNLEDGGLLGILNFGEGVAGNVDIDIPGNISINGGDFELLTGILNQKIGLGDGENGNIRIETPSLSLSRGGQINANTSGPGNVGDVRIVSSNIEGNGGSIFTRTGIFSSNFSPTSSGNIGSILISTNSLILRNGATISANNFGQGNTGGIQINTSSLTVLDGSQLTANNTGNGGSARGIRIKADDFALFRGNEDLPNNRFRPSAIFSRINEGGQGSVGGISVEAGRLDLIDGAQFSSTTAGEGDAGNITIEISDNGAVILDNSTLISEVTSTSEVDFGSGGVGDGGDITIRAGSLHLENGSFILADTENTGDAGSIDLDIDGLLTISGRGPGGLSREGNSSSQISSTVDEGGVGDAGRITIQAGTLSIDDDGFISSSTQGIGDGQDISIYADGAVALSNSSILTAVARASESSPGSDDMGNEIGNAGNAGNAGSSFSSESSLGSDDISNETESTENSGSAASNLSESEPGSGGMGNGGDILIRANSLTLSDGASLLANTESVGNAGNITVMVDDFLNLTGMAPSESLQGEPNPSRISTTAEEGSFGEGGNISIRASSVSISDGGEIETEIFSEGQEIGGEIEILGLNTLNLDNGRISVASVTDTQASSLNISANEVRLNNGSVLSADSRVANGGNVNLTLDNLLLLFDNSQITTTSGSEGNGGNINISAPFIVSLPLENSDIAANASDGAGGQVNINAQGVFGIEPRPAQTPLSDITASSEQGVNGAVAITALDTSFIQNNLTELPGNLIDPDNLVANSCIAQSQPTDSAFEIIGSSPDENPNQTTSTPFSTGGVSTLPDPTASQRQADEAILEPEAIHQLADGRLVMVRNCQ